MKIYLGSVAWRQVEQGHHSSVVQLFLECARRGIEIREGSVVGDALVSRARSLAASAFLRSDCDILLSIDSDIWFRPEDAIELCEQALAGHDVIGALYMTRAIKTQPAMMLPDEPIVFAAGQGPVGAQFISTGFTAVTRAPFEALAKTLPLCHQTWRQGNQDTSFWPFYMPFTIPWEGDGHIYLSEDWAFCQRAKEAGFKLWVYPGIRVGHYGSYMYTLEDLIRPERPLPQPLKFDRQPNGNLDIQGFGYIAPEIYSLPADLASYLYISKPEELMAEIAKGKLALAELWEKKPTGQSDLQFYRRKDVGQAYIRDLGLWHINPKIAQLFSGNLASYKNKGLRILDFGSGIGTTALMLSEGNEVDCLEPNWTLRDFTEYRAKRHGRRIGFITGDLPKGSHDLALCIHVLEHLEKPEEAAAKIHAALKPGGLLFTESDFTDDDGGSPMHHISEDKLGAHYWNDLGMKRVSTYWWRKPNGTED